MSKNGKDPVEQVITGAADGVKYYADACMDVVGAILGSPGSGDSKKDDKPECTCVTKCTCS